MYACEAELAELARRRTGAGLAVRLEVVVLDTVELHYRVQCANLREDTVEERLWGDVHLAAPESLPICAASARPLVLKLGKQTSGMATHLAGSGVLLSELRKRPPARQSQPWYPNRPHARRMRCSRYRLADVSYRYTWRTSCLPIGSSSGSCPFARASAGEEERARGARTIW